MKTTILIFLAYAFLLAAPIVSRLRYLLDTGKKSSDFNDDFYDYR